MAKKWIFGAPQNPASASATAVAIPPTSTADAKKYGLENFGNTCYANSVVQALYFCTPFRELLIQAEDRLALDDGADEALAQSPPPSAATPVRGRPERRPSTSNGFIDPTPADLPPPPPPAVPIPSTPPTLFSALRSLYLHISTSPTDKGTVAPRAFIDKVREGNEIFRTSMHQDAHEFLNYLLNKIVEEVEEDRKILPDAAPEDLSSSVTTLDSKVQPTINTNSSNSGTSPQDATLVHKLFEGILTSETRCLTCETVSSRDESFLDLSIDIEQNSSVTACLRQFSASEMLCHKNKFFCDSCCDLQEAEKRMKIKKLPNVLALHLKRFKYQEDLQKYIKLAYRVAFPFELRLFNTVDDTDDADRLFNLFAIVVHIGNGPHHGHYISIIKTGGSWLVFDDDTVYPLPESEIPKYFGESNAGSAYVLYYQAADIDLPGLGIRQPSPVAPDLMEQDLSAAVDPFASPVLSSNPPLPPGLVEEENSSDLSDPPFPITPSQSSSPRLHPLTKPTLDVKVLGLDDLPPPISSPGPSSPATSINTTAIPRKGLFGTVKRRPSSSASSQNGWESRKSVAEKSGIPPVSALGTPATVIEGEVTALPPRPPTSPGRMTEPEPRHKEPERKASTWFGKRKSLRMNDKGRTASEYGSLPDVPPSPGEGSSSSWFKTTQAKGRRPSEPSLFDGLQTLSSHARPKSSGGGLAVSDYRRNGYESSSPAASVSSSVGSSHGPSGLSASSPTASRSFDFPPSRGPSLDKSATVKAPKHEKSFPHISNRKTRVDDDMRVLTPPPRPATATGATRAPTSPRAIPPPVPPIPFEVLSSPDSPSPVRSLPNGYANGLLKGKARSSDHGHDAASPSLQSMVGANNSATSTSSSMGSTGNGNGNGNGNGSSSWKRTSRKLSLTAPMLGLGFGKSKKERERERERDGGKGPPSAFNGPGQSVLANH